MDYYTSGDYKYLVKENGTVEIAKYLGEAEELTIPSELDGYSVTSIGTYAFGKCSSLISVVIPESVEYISPSAFDDNVKFVIGKSRLIELLCDSHDKKISMYE